MSKSSNKLINIALVVIGAGLIIWGYQKSSGFSSQLSNAFTGSYSDNVMLIYIIGATCLAIGIFRYVKK